MANNTYNFVNIEGNQVPLLTRTEILSGETQIFNSGDKLLYVFGSEHPSNFHFDFGEAPEEDSIDYNWGRYDVPGIKRNRTSIIDPEGEMGDIVDEAGILIRNTSQFEIQIMGYFGNNFHKDTAVVASAENPNDNVGYWAQIDSINKIQNGEAESKRYTWMHDQYGNEMERIYLYVQYTNNTVLQNATTSTKATIESDALAGNSDYNIEIARIVGSALQITKDADNFLFTSPDDTECVIQEIGGELRGQINVQVPGGVFKMHYEGNNVESFEALEAGSTYEEMVTGTIIDRGYLLIDTDAADDAEKNIIVDHSSIQNADEEGVESDQALVAFIWPTLQGTVTKVTFFGMGPVTGIISGSVEGSFLSGATVTGTDANGNKMIAITNSNGYYEFPREAVGEIKARGGSNEITGENYDEAEADEIEIVTEDLVTDSSMGGIISPVSTLLTELKNNEGLDNDEALKLLAEQGQELFDLPSNLADKSKIKQYLQIGLNGLQNSEGNDVEEYAGFLQFSKKIAEQEQLFVDTNLTSSIQKTKKKRAANDYRQSLTRFMKRKKDGDVAKYKTDYLTKAGTDSTASAINDSAPSQKDQFYLVLADAVEKVDGYVSDNERLASSKADFKLKAKEMMEETIDNDQSISTSGKDYEAIAIQLNEEYMRRKMAAREEQHARYQGNKSTFAAKKTAQTFKISKTSEGYVRSGSIIKQIGESKVEVSSNAKTSSTFLENTNVAKYNSKIKEGGVEKQLQKKSTGEVRPEVRETENSGVTGLEIRNPNYVILSVGMVGFDNANSFGGNSNSYSIEASSGIKIRGRGLNNNIRVYNFIIKDSNGEIISSSYNNNLEFRRVANAFVELYSVHGSTAVQKTEVYGYLNPFIVESIDSDGDGVVDSLDDFPNDPSRSNIAPWKGTFRVGDSAYGNGSLTLNTYFNNLDNVDIDWGDGQTETFTGGRPQHTYASTGDYQVSFKFKGTEYWQSNNRALTSAGDSRKLISIEQWGDFVWNSNMMWGEVVADVTATDVPTLTENFTGFSKSTFTFSAAATKAWENIDLSPVRSIANLFQSCYSGVAQFGIDKWDTSQITTMSNTFSQRSPGDLIRNWNTSNVTNMYGMFASSSVGGDTLKTKVVNLGEANEYIAWDVSKVTSFGSFSSYGNAGSGTLDISNWQINTSAPVNMQSMFFRGGMPMEDLAKKTVTLENGTSYEAWNTSQVTNMKQMFYRSSTAALNIDNASWDTRNVTDIQDFHFSYSGYPIPQQWDRDISGWDLSALINKNLGLFNYNNMNTAKFSTENYDKILIAWDAAGYTEISVNFGQSQFTPGGTAEAAKTSLASKGWTITDGGAAPLPMKMTYRIEEGSLNAEVRHANTVRTNAYTIAWGDGNLGDQDNNTHVYTSAGDYQITITGDFDPLLYNMTQLISVDQWGSYDHYLGGDNVSYGAFMGCTNLEILAEDACVLYGTSLKKCFQGVGTLANANGSMNLWDTSAITDMSYLTFAATGFTADISQWQTDNVTDMRGMFAASHYRGPYNQFNGNINTKLRADGNLAWNTEKVVHMNNMFHYNYVFNQDISKWNTDSLNTLYAFNSPWIGSTNMTTDFSTKEVTLGSHTYIAWDVRAVSYFQYAFGTNGNGAPGINGISNWNTSNATRMDSMFGGVNTTDESWDLSTREVTVGDRTYTAWDTSKVTNMSNMFMNFLGGNDKLNGISTWDVSSLQNMDSFARSFGTFNQDLSGWNTASLLSAATINMATRYGLSDLDTSFAGWDITNFASGKGITGWSSQYGALSSISTANYDATLISFASQNVQSGMLLGFGSSKYTSHGAAETARNTLIAAGVTITDGGPVLKEFFYDGGDGESSSSGACSLAAAETRGYFYGSGSYPAEGDEIYTANSRSEDNYLAEGYYKIATADNTFSYAYTGGDGSIEEFGECSTSVQYNYGNADRGQEGACNARSLDNTFYVAEEIGKEMPATLYKDAALTAAIDFSRSADGYYPFQLNGSNTRQTFNLSRGRFGEIGSCR